MVTSEAQPDRGRGEGSDMAKKAPVGKRSRARASGSSMHQKSNNRHHRQDENGLQDTHHHGVVVVHPICRGLPHFALPLLLVSTNQPPQGEAGWYIAQPNDCDKGLGWAQGRG